MCVTNAFLFFRVPDLFSGTAANEMCFKHVKCWFLLETWVNLETVYFLEATILIAIINLFGVDVLEFADSQWRSVLGLNSTNLDVALRHFHLFYWSSHSKKAYHRSTLCTFSSKMIIKMYDSYHTIRAEQKLTCNDVVTRKVKRELGQAARKVRAWLNNRIRRLCMLMITNFELACCWGVL